MSSEQRKVLEDIQRAKRLLKEGAAASLGMHTGGGASTPSSLMTPTPPAFPPQAPAGIGDMMMSPGMRSAMQVLAQANVSSFGYFIPQDSHFGNSILPVLPRIDAPAGATAIAATNPTAASSISPSAAASS